MASLSRVRGVRQAPAGVRVGSMRFRHRGKTRDDVRHDVHAETTTGSRSICRTSSMIPSRTGERPLLRPLRLDGAGSGRRGLRPEEAVVTIMSYCVRGSESRGVAGELLELNHRQPFGAFSMVETDVFFSHALFGRDLSRAASSAPSRRWPRRRRLGRPHRRALRRPDRPRPHPRIAGRRRRIAHGSGNESRGAEVATLTPYSIDARLAPRAIASAASRSAIFAARPGACRRACGPWRARSPP